MNTELFIAKKIVRGSQASFSKPIVRIAILGITLGFVVMFISIAILTGFQLAIREKVIGFGSHIQITRFEENSSLEPAPVTPTPELMSTLRNTKGVAHVQVFAVKPGILKTQDQIQGILFKGIGKDYDWSYFRDRVIEGSPITLPDTGRTDDVLISSRLAGMMKIRLNDPLRVYFIRGNTTSGRKFNVKGIYNTGLEEFDKVYVIGDLRHVRKLNNWDSTQVGGIEVLLKNFSDLDRVGKAVYKEVGFDLDAKTIRDLYPQIFDWLNLQNVNVIIILVLMVLVSGITMISTLLILILERTSMIGILKSLGMRSNRVRRIFLINAVYIIGWGLLWGNVAGFGLCLLQKYSGIFKLPQESYYVSVVPVNLDPLYIILLNAGTILVCLVMLIVPSYIIARITPVRAVRFE